MENDLVTEKDQEPELPVESDLVPVTIVLNDSPLGGRGENIVLHLLLEEEDLERIHRRVQDDDLDHNPLCALSTGHVLNLKCLIVLTVDFEEENEDLSEEDMEMFKDLEEN